MMMKVKSSGQEISVADVRIKDIREAAFWKKHLSRNDYYNEMGQGKKWNLEAEIQTSTSLNDGL